jgi:hypothetical protein
MSVVLLRFAESFVESRLSPEIFSVAYMELWKIERDGVLTQADPPGLSECLSTIFCLADMYAPGDEPLDVGELNGESLKAEVAAMLKLLNKGGLPTP